MSLSMVDIVRSEPADEAGPILAGQATLHHFGFVVQSISSVGEQFARCMSARWNGQVIHDPLQRVRVAFLTPVLPANPVFELVEPADPDSPVSNFLKRGGGLHHVCYEVDDIESVLRKAQEFGFIVTSPPTPAVAFGGRRIAWVWSKTKNPLLLEFLERPRGYKCGPPSGVDHQ
jgi:methylmalonyl-CoA/ethylmalonyl-CoA epimerase